MITCGFRHSRCRFTYLCVKEPIIVPAAGFVWARQHSRLDRSAALLAALLLGFTVPDAPARAAASKWSSNAHGATRLIAAVEATGSSAQLDVGLQLRLTPGWHTYWRTPGDAGISPTIDWQGSESLGGAAIAWPAGLEILWALVLGFTLSDVVQAAVTRGEMIRRLPDDLEREVC